MERGSANCPDSTLAVAAGDAIVDTIMFTGTADFTAGAVEHRRARSDVFSASRRRYFHDLGDKQVVSSGEAGRRFHP